MEMRYLFALILSLRVTKKWLPGLSLWFSLDLKYPSLWIMLLAFKELYRTKAVNMYIYLHLCSKPYIPVTVCTVSLPPPPSILIIPPLQDGERMGFCLAKWWSGYQGFFCFAFKCNTLHSRNFYKTQWFGTDNHCKQWNLDLDLNYCKIM